MSFSAETAKKETGELKDETYLAHPIPETHIKETCGIIIQQIGVFC
jgi:hypothetical protein